MGLNIGGAAVVISPGTTLAVNGATEFMAVNANGIVTRPNTPHFCGQISNKGNIYHPGEGVALKLDANSNVGNCWNTTNGAFTCPVAGKYVITGSGIMSGVGSGYFYIRKNGVEQIYTHWNHTSSWHYTSISLVLQCAASDYIYYTVERCSAGMGIYGQGGHGMFSIALLP